MSTTGAPGVRSGFVVTNWNVKSISTYWFNVNVDGCPSEVLNVDAKSPVKTKS